MSGGRRQARFVICRLNLLGALSMRGKLSQGIIETGRKMIKHRLKGWLVELGSMRFAMVIT